MTVLSTVSVIQIFQLLTIRNRYEFRMWKSELQELMKIFPTLDKGFPNVTTIFYSAQTNEKRNQRKETECLQKDQM